MMRGARPYISVVISTYNSEAFIAGRLQNLVEQTVFSETEIIVINSGSKQNEELVVKQFQERYKNIHYYLTPQRETIYRAWNRGIRTAIGRYITNANADDRLRNDALEILANGLKRHPEVALVYGDQLVTHQPGVSFSETFAAGRLRRPSYSRLKLLSSCEIGSQPMWRASIHFDENVWFDERFEVAGDYDFECRIAERHPLLHIPIFLGSYYRSADSSNKEFQDIPRTLSESADIQVLYTQRLVDSLLLSERIALKRYLRWYLLLPKYIHVGLFRFLRKVYPENTVLPRAFVCWLSSLIAQKDGEIEKAIRYCKQCLHWKNAMFIQRQYESLLAIARERR